MGIARRGWILIDTTFGMAIIGVLATVLALAMGRQQQAAVALAESRAAVRLAERALTDLQAGGRLPPGDADTRLDLRRVDGGPGIDGYAWVEVTVHTRDHVAAVTGLVPRTGLDK